MTVNAIGRKIDLTGQRFGRLAVIREAENKDGRTAWYCRCDCGNIIVAKTTHLRAGKVTSCGCLRGRGAARPFSRTEKQAKPTIDRGYSTKKLDLTGQRFGMLTVIEKAPNIGRDTAWRCRCDCGNERVVRTANLRKGRTTSCGCAVAGPRLDGSNRLDLTGQRFGKLVAIKPLPKSGQTYKWLCHCDCGNECVVAVANLRNGHSQSCGCESALPQVHLVDGTNVELLRSSTIRSNNTSGVTGVTWRKKDRRWCAEIGFQGKRYYLGLYEKFDDAVQKRKEAEERYFGSFLADYDANSASNEPH